MSRFVVGFACGVATVFAWAILTVARAEAANLRVERGNNVIQFPTGPWGPPAC